MNNPMWAILTVDAENMNSPLREKRYKDNLLTIGTIRPIAKICDRFNIKAVFFLSVFEHCIFSKDSLREVAQYLANEGHDVQLHTHPYWCYGLEHMWQYPLPEQIKIIKEGRELLFEWLGRYPIAHRAGAYGINRDTIKALHANNVYIDSSMFFQHSNCKINWSKNRLVEKNNVVEIPVTGFFRQKYITLGDYKLNYRKKFIKTDIDWCTIDELVHFVRQAKANNIKLMNLFMHSYSLLKHDGRFRHFKLDIKKGQMLSEFLKICTQDLGIHFITIQQLWNKYQNNPQKFLGNDFVPVSSVNIDIIQLFLARLKEIVAGKNKNS